ncbi:MAG: hypothetical protein ACRBDI_04910 [Alphaproteobacteria bacterium]
MSYYTSKNPGLLPYIILIIATVTALLTPPPNTEFIGFLSILWGGFTLMRVLSLFEITEHLSHSKSSAKISKNNNHLTSALAYDLTHRMNENTNFKGGQRALKSLDLRSITWLILAGIYAIYSIYAVKNAIPTTQTLTNMSLFFIIGSAFWTGQSYAHSHSANKILLGLFIVLSIICALKIGIHHIQWNESIIRTNILALTQTPALYALLFLAAYCIISSLYAGLLSLRKLPVALLCTTLIISMAALYITLPAHNTMPLWLCSWGVFSMLWIKCFSTSKKRYIMYQCQ